MTIFESLTKRFFKDRTLDNSSITDVTRVVDELSGDYDLTGMIPAHLLPYDLKRKELTVAQNIQSYRNLALSADGSTYIEEIINEIFNTNNDALPKIKIKNVELPKKLEQKIEEAYLKILSLLDFSRNGNDLIRQWYVDGHLFLECIYDKENMKKGIQTIFTLDPMGLIKEFNEYTKKTVFKYNLSSGNGAFYGSFLGQEYDQEQIVHISSGLKDEKGQPIGYLHPAVKPGNQMHMIEDMIVVYRITRGSEKRAIKVNVGNMPKAKAVSFMSELVNKFRNTRTYNSSTGTVDNNSHLMAITEDIWLPTKNSTKDIEIDTIAGGMQLNEIDDLHYFRNKLLTALKIPAGRFKEDTTFDISATEINKQEERFSRLINTLRSKFNEIFIELLRRELICTGAMNEQEFIKIKKNIKFVYPDESSIQRREFFINLNKKVEAIGAIDSYVGKYFTEEYIQKEILEMSEKDIEDFKAQLAKEQQTKFETVAGDEDTNIDLDSQENSDEIPAEPTV